MTRLLIGIADVAGARSVYDPCCGVGSLLVAAHRENPHAAIYGKEYHLVSWALCKLRLTLLNISADIEFGNALEAPMRSGPTFDRVVCDPPFGPQVLRTVPEAARAEVATTTRVEALFLEHCNETMAKEGKAAIVVPQGVLFRRGFEERLRYRLAIRGAIRSITALPAGSANSTSVETAIIGLSRVAAIEPTIRMTDATRIAPTRSKLRGLTDEQISQIIAAATGSTESATTKEIPLEQVLKSDQFRPASYFVGSSERPPVRYLIAQARAAEARAAEYGAEADRLLESLLTHPQP